MLMIPSDVNVSVPALSDQVFLCALHSSQPDRLSCRKTDHSVGHFVKPHLSRLKLMVAVFTDFVSVS